MNAAIDMPIVERSPQTTAQALALVSGAKAMLEQAVTVDELQDAHTLAGVGKTFLRARADAHDAYLMAAETELRAERKLGEWLARQPKAKGGNPTLPTGDTMSQVAEAPSLADLGITRQDSSRWQKLAAVKNSTFEAYVSTTMNIGKPPTAAGARRLLPPTRTPTKKTRHLGRRTPLRLAWACAPTAEREALMATVGMPFTADNFSLLVRLDILRSTRAPRPEQHVIEFVLDGGEVALALLGLDWTVTDDTLLAAAAAHPDREGEFFFTNAYNKVKVFLDSAAEANTANGGTT